MKVLNCGANEARIVRGTGCVGKYVSGVITLAVTDSFPRLPVVCCVTAKEAHGKCEKY